MKQTTSIIFLSRLYHPHVGGVEKHLRILSKELTDKGFEVSIITEEFERGLKDKEILDGVTIYRIPVGKNPSTKKFLIWKWMARNIGLLRSADIIHVHDVFFWVLPFRPLLFLNKIYVTFHGYEGYPIKKRWIAQRKVAEMLSNGSICVGDFMKKWYFASPTLISYGGVRLEAKNMSENPQSAVFFGRLDDQTGILDYIKAYKKIKEKYPKFKFTVIGDGKYLKKIPKSVARKPFTPNIEKYIEGNRFVFVSRYLSMLESLVLKKEIISVYSDPVMKDYLFMSPFRKYISISKNSDEIADEVIKALKKGKDDKKINQAYDWARSNTWEKVTNNYLRLWGLNK